MKIHPDQYDLLDRGGRPTLRDLIDRMEFRPGDGTISLSGARLVLQRVSMKTDLQQQLIRRFGKDEAMATLLRVGYNAGREDADFIRKTWPNIDIGDAFTAGTRLHMVTGTVRVDTLTNDFDFGKDRFRAEFEWRESAEAMEYARRFGRALFPVCWSQLGYASGYASEFFRKIVIYKEIQCAAMGHKACRLQGKTIDAWGDDAFARFFAENVLPGRADPVARRPVPARPVQNPVVVPEDAARSIDAIVMAPLQPALGRLAGAVIGGLICGPEGSGQERVAGWLAERLAAGQGPVQAVSAGDADLSAVIAGLDDLRRPGVLLLGGVERMTVALQNDLVIRLARPGGRPLVAWASVPSCALTEVLVAPLRHRLTTLPLELPPLADRRADLPDLARAVLHERFGSQSMGFGAAALLALSAHDWPGELAEFEATVLRAMLLTEGRDVITEEAVKAALHRPADRGGDTALDRVWDLLLPDLAAGRLQIADLAEGLYRKALERAGGNVAEAARTIGLSRAQLAYRLKARTDADPRSDDQAE